MVTNIDWMNESSLLHIRERNHSQEITVSVDYTIKGDSNFISVSYKKLAEHLKPGGLILWSDGTISLTVLSCDQSLGLVRCRCENSALLGEREKVCLPCIETGLPALTEQDKEDILQWGLPNTINIIALSSVRKGSDLDEARELLGVHGKSIMLMSKVENEQGVANVPRWIITAQKRMIEKANALGKPVVTTIQVVLDSTSCRSTSAEATGVDPESVMQTM
ncbi:hypothetical protein AALP_AA8G219900 [Arabis alpina]|uniref:pyruvate kinase n=1 Tax=Arabis alpina TaxID=50452 RepID=A0A087G8M8_ARAAL|nr:hypothetical protein AALP_AA8G219900 [Arabis alpina]